MCVIRRSPLATAGLVLLLLDVLTYPAQEWLFGWEDEKDPKDGRVFPETEGERYRSRNVVW